MKTSVSALVLGVMIGGVGCASAPDSDESVAALSSTASLLVSNNAAGQAGTYSASGSFDFTNPFFVSLGTNQRVCASCHDKNTGWTITPAGILATFNSSNGTAPIFRTVDGSNSPKADVSTVAARRSAYSMLLNRGLIRIGLPIPANAEFDLAAVDDPYGYASAAELSLFRRPLPTTNLTFLSGVMWDGRFGAVGPLPAQQLTDQSNAATQSHAQALVALTDAQRNQIYAFEIELFTAQLVDNGAGNLFEANGQGGPQFLSTQTYYAGINDPLGKNPSAQPFNANAITIYSAWAGNSNAARAAVARGQALFDTKPISISGVKGLNDILGVATVAGTCTTCHDTPNVGNHSVALPLDIGLTDESRRTADMPLYTLRNKTTGALLKVTDPGRALVTGKWADISRFKGAILRGLAARPPYFHNGFAADLGAAVDFYDTRFGIGFTSQERSDLVAFLTTL